MFRYYYASNDIAAVSAGVIVFILWLCAVAVAVAMSLFEWCNIAARYHRRHHNNCMQFFAEPNKYSITIIFLLYSFVRFCSILFCFVLFSFRFARHNANAFVHYFIAVCALLNCRCHQRYRSGWTHSAWCREFNSFVDSQFRSGEFTRMTHTRTHGQHFHSLAYRRQHLNIDFSPRLSIQSSEQYNNDSSSTNKMPAMAFRETEHSLLVWSDRRLSILNSYMN